MSQRVKISRERGSQIVRIPNELELPGDEVDISLVDGRLLLTPVDPKTVTTVRDLVAYLRTMEPVDLPHFEIDDPFPEPVGPLAFEADDGRR
ncbi:hypothetical protein [Aurantimonas sp. Leaf443]|uniref:AbrB/MazE/SpoVT family DNA-binding domain-containing protein n=1 Tax=Aurantimonas sp. Leaf443 TaxID=1736378 RepID=UPI0006F20541|nr:hypothetical protein [Aurantimonas sp. Leaf443]KQT85806.1 hypothetical protein ASG48_04080 [Aurantimonas sp. Leaf443]